MKARFSRCIAETLLLLWLCNPLTVSAHDPVFPGEKLKALFPQAASFEQKNLYMSDDQRRIIEHALGSSLPEEDLQPSIYLAIVNSGPGGTLKKAAAIMFIDAYGAGGKIEMGVMVSGKGELVNVMLFENSESEALRKPAFLDQFAGKKAGESFRAGEDISLPPSDESSAQAIASGAKRGLLIINEMFKKK